MSGFSSIKVLNNQQPASECKDSSRTDQLTIVSTPSNKLKREKFISIAKELNKFTPSVNPLNIASDLAISFLLLPLTCFSASNFATAVSSCKNAE